MPQGPIPAPGSPAESTASPAGGISVDELLPAVYDELRSLAASQLGRAARQPHLTLQPTSLVHEAYLRMSRRGLSFEGRRHFFFVAARAMRDILIERARRHGRRGQRLEIADVPEAADGGASRDVDLLALDEALRDLERHDPVVSEVVMLRFFAGLEVNEAAELVGRSPRTVKREWAFARAWLRRSMEA